MIIWVSFLRLNLIYYDESILMIIVEVIEHQIKVDNNTRRFENESCGLIIHRINNFNNLDKNIIPSMFL